MVSESCIRELRTEKGSIYISAAKSTTPRGVPNLQVPLQNLNTQTGPTQRRGRPETTQTALLSMLRAFAGNVVTLSLHHRKHANGITRYATRLTDSHTQHSSQFIHALNFINRILVQKSL